MADEKINDSEEIVTLDDGEDFEEEIITENEEEEKNITQSPKKINTTLIISIFLSAIILLTILAIFLLQKEEENITDIPETNATEIIKNLKKTKREYIPKSKIEKLTLEAKRLYQNGQKNKAMQIFAQISNFQKALSSFNLGVAYLKSKQYDKAIQNFSDSFSHDDLKFESAFNIALCYKAKKDFENFKKYINIANTYIMSKYNSPLFDYYKGLIYYYQNRPIESLALLNKYNKDYFKNQKNTLMAKNFILVKNYDDAINKLTQTNIYNNYLIGILYSKIGKYSLAASAFNRAIQNKQNLLKSYIALSLVQNKMGLFESCSSTIKTALNKFEDNATKVFPIKVKIKESLYNPELAQKEFQKSIFKDQENLYGLIFYFAPYKLFDPKQSNTIIYKGAKEIYINDTVLASSYLQQAKSISQINIEIIKGLKLLDKHKIYEANKIFKNIIYKYPNHSVLHYNLALTYANISDYKSAKKHFEKSFLLDNKNYLAAFFAAYSAILLNKDYHEDTLVNLIKYAPKDKVHKLKILYSILKNNTSIEIKNNLKSPFDIVLNIIIANLQSNYTKYKELTQKLIKLMPNDLVANIIYTDEISQGKNIKEYAKNIQTYLVNKIIDISPLLYGETFPRELYVNILNIAGSVPYLEKTLENEYATNQNQIALKQSLAYTYIFTKKFEKAYQLYNSLIDDYKQDFPHNLYLGALAAIGSRHHANGVALLELANLEDNLLFESRYALGLLYQEAHNLEAAAIQYLKIGNSGFKSRYINFELTTIKN